MISDEEDISGITRTGIGTRLKPEGENIESSNLSSRTRHIIELNVSRRKIGGWKCKHCEAIFETKAKLYQHIQLEHSEFCSKTKKKLWTCKFCGKDDFGSRRLLFEHCKNCSGKEKFPKDSLGRIKGQYDRSAQTKKALATRRKNGTLGHPCTDEQRAHIAEAMRKYRARLGILHKANVSENACKYIDELNIQKGWQLQHGLNGGEKQVGPYFVDGYDVERNIVFEYYEKSHHKNRKIEEHDTARARYIKKELNCKFFIYDELSDSLYEFLG